MLRRMSISAFGDKVPQFGPGVFVHVDATVIGDVVLEEGVTVWPGAVLRGDIERISVAAETSFQDGVVIHTDPGAPVGSAAAAPSATAPSSTAP